ncbi:MAG: hypothetical protein JEY99_19905 [Spirochaetales bacterium]|nr:hypothetical protein [Spirochaetales bacterium]
MFKEITHSIVGKWGSLVLDFYIENQLIFNLLIVTYAGIMLVLRVRRRKRSEKQNRESYSK